MATASTQQTLRAQLPPLTSFLTLAPATSSSYPTHRRTDSESSTASVVTPSAPAVVQDQDQVAASTSTVTVPVAVEATVVTVDVPAVEEEKKFRRSSSLSSQGQFRFLRLGPVHHGAHLEGDGDWSEEVAVSE